MGRHLVETGVVNVPARAEVLDKRQKLDRSDKNTDGHRHKVAGNEKACLPVFTDQIEKGEQKRDEVYVKGRLRVSAQHDQAVDQRSEKDFLRGRPLVNDQRKVKAKG